jgi:hypothetical protein
MIAPIRALLLWTLARAGLTLALPRGEAAVILRAVEKDRQSGGSAIFLKLIFPISAVCVGPRR